MKKEIKDRVLAHVKYCGLCNYTTVAEELGLNRATVRKAISEGLQSKEIKVDYATKHFTKYVEYVKEGDFSIKEITSIGEGEWDEIVIKGICYDVIEAEEDTMKIVEKPFVLQINKRALEQIFRITKSTIPFF